MFSMLSSDRSPYTGRHDMEQMT